MATTIVYRMVCVSSSGAALNSCPSNLIDSSSSTFQAFVGYLGSYHYFSVVPVVGTNYSIVTPSLSSLDFFIQLMHLVCIDLSAFLLFAAFCFSFLFLFPSPRR